MTNRRYHHRRRSDRWRGHGPTLGAGIWLTLISLLVLVSLLGQHAALRRADTAAAHADRAIVNIQDGRRVSLSVTCTMLQAVLASGRQVIERGSGPDTPFTRNLERLGYPPLKVRQKAAKQAAQAYTMATIRVLESNPLTRGLDVLRPDGTVDCDRIQQLARVH